MLDIRESDGLAPEALGSGKYRIRIIAPGQGSSGVYTAENLAESVGLFKAGTEMFLDHATATEDQERPERSLRDYAGVFLEDASVGEDGALYTVCKVFSGMNDLIKDKWEHVGVSINAWCDEPLREDGTVPVISGVRSVDFVTTPGAGGAIIDLLESKYDTGIENQEESMSDEKLDGIEELLKQVLDLVKPKEKEEPKDDGPSDAEIAKKALEAGEAIAESGLPAAAAARVRESVLSGADVQEAIEAERKYLKEAAIIEAAPAVEEDGETVLRESYKSIGW